MPTLKKKKPLGQKQNVLTPLTKGAVLEDVDLPGIPDSRDAIGKLLKNISFDDFIIPARLANKKIKDHFILTPANPVIENKGGIMVARSFHYDGRSGFENLSSDSSVYAHLQNMYFKGALVQIEVSEFQRDMDPGYQIDVWTPLNIPRQTYSAYNGRASRPHKHYLSFDIIPTDAHSWMIKLSRFADGWSVSKVKVFILEGI